MLKSHFRGSGLQFKEHRVYEHGDDVKFIDWKLLAKTSHPYIKTFEEERNVEIVVLIDASPTMLSGFQGVSKLQASIEICCLLYLLAKESGDYIHAYVVSDEIIEIEKANGETGVIHLISNLKRLGILNEDGQVNLLYDYKKEISEEQIKALIAKNTRRRELVIFSDFCNSITIHNIPVRRNIHSFRILSPLDDASAEKFFVHAKSGISDIRGTSGSIQSKENRKKFLSKKIRDLKVHDKYLENFVKEMM